MNTLELRIAWELSGSPNESVDSRLIKLLKAIHESGKLSAAAADCGISYRHAWNLIDYWGQQLGVTLIEKQRGRGSRLSALGEKLIWAEERVNARLGPAMESLNSEVNREIAQLLQTQLPVLRVHASHGYAVALLPQLLEALTLDIQYCSPTEALHALSRNASDLAGFHLPIGIRTRLYPEYQACLNAKEHQVIHFICRTQGLMVAPGNPLSVTSLEHIVCNNARFINRQYHSGTRALFDALIEKQGISRSSIKGYQQEEFTHSAVAAYIASGMADVGFGVEAAACQFGLDFIPIIEERYLLACNKYALESTAMQVFLETIRGKNFLAAVEKLPGYSSAQCGELCSLESL